MWQVDDLKQDTSKFHHEIMGKTLVDILCQRAIQDGDSIAYRFLSEGSEAISETETQEWSHSQLAEKANLVASSLNQKGCLKGSRALIIVPAGLDFIAAFYGCLQAGVIAVPLQPPSRKQDTSRWLHIVRDAKPTVVITVSQLHERAKQLIFDSFSGQQGLPPLSSIHIMDVDALSSAVPVFMPACGLPMSNDIAMLQYTSGSTRLPRGVQITHANLMYNLEQIRLRFGHTVESRGVIWLPPHHDMGLIGGILQPLYVGFPVTLMSPVSFLRRPARWLQAISHFAATTSGGPNFAYEYCIRRCTDTDIDGLDLSQWNVAFNGAETIRSSTLKRFSERFAGSGFHESAFLPCYGLAEATLLVASGVSNNDKPQSLALEREALRHNHAKVAASESNAQLMIGSGNIASGTEVRIVNATSRELLKDGGIGEIWVSSPGVSSGYWLAEDSNTATFSATLKDGSGSFLRTGDLGFMNQGQLYVTGRLSDLIILRGVNYAPQDIELSVEVGHIKFLPSATSAFSVDVDDDESLIVVQELERGKFPQEQIDKAMAAVRAAISNDHGVQVKAVILVKQTTLPKTPSGKVQRQRCKTMYLGGALNIVAQWPALETIAVPQVPVCSSVAQPMHSKIQPRQADRDVTDDRINWLRDYSETHINSQQMDERRSLSPSVLLDFGNQGLLGMQVSKGYGGLGLGHEDSQRIIEQLAAIDPTLALFVGLNNVLGIRPINHFGSTEMREQWLPKLASGRELGAFAVTEAGAGSNPLAMNAVAKAQGRGRYLLNGTKFWSGSAAWAGITNVFVRQCDCQGRVTGISAFVVPKGRKGLKQGPEALTMGMRAMVQNSVILDDVSVSDADRLGQANQGMIVAQDAMMHGRFVIAAACVGGMKRCAQLMVRYASRRTVAGGRLLELPVLQQRLHEVTSSIAALSALVDWISQRLDQGLPVPEEVYAVCKILGPEWYWRATDWLVQCLGGRGYIESNIAPQLLRDARVLRIFEGPTETLANYLGVRSLRQTSSLCVLFSEVLQDRGSESTWLPWVEQLQQQPNAQKACMAALGESTAFIILGSILKQSTAIQNNDSILWLERESTMAQGRLERLIQQSSNHSSTFYQNQAQSLSQKIENYGLSIGDIDQQCATEDYALDDLLLRESLSLEPCNKYSVEPIVGATHSIESATTELNVKAWLTQWLATKLNLDATTVDTACAFADFGVDSVLAVELAHDLETAFSLPESLDPTLAWNYPTIDVLAIMIAGIKEEQSEPSLTSLNSEPEIDWAKQLQAELAPTVS